jgi:hypothetical protein
MCGEQQVGMRAVFQSTDAITHLQKNQNVPFLPLPFAPFFDPNLPIAVPLCSLSDQAA